jgi:hypothetical protein
MFKKGDFVKVNERIGVVVMTGAELPGDSGDHAAVWFGTAKDGVPDVWTMPMEYLDEAPNPVLKH